MSEPVVKLYSFISRVGTFNKRTLIIINICISKQYVCNIGFRFLILKNTSPYSQQLTPYFDYGESTSKVAFSTCKFESIKS